MKKLDNEEFVFTVRLWSPIGGGSKGQSFETQFSSTSEEMALRAAKRAASMGLALAPIVKVLDKNGSVVWRPESSPDV